MISLPPIVRILDAMKIAAMAGDYTQAAGAKPVTVRHSRNRKPVTEEKPAISLIFVGDEPAPEEQGSTAWEVQRVLTVDAQYDVDLKREDGLEDETGLLTLLLLEALFIAALRDADDGTVWLGGMVDWIRVGESDPDDRSQPDKGRMTRALRVLYRVRMDDTNELLFQGVNA